MIQTELETTLKEDKKYYVIWENRRIGYFLNGVYFDRKSFPSGELNDSEFETLLGTTGKMQEGKLIRNDGTSFKLICEDDLKALQRTRSARGGTI
ncbi:hypothetical protein [Vibrio tarriae]|uniref:hypothetical protein n=1 Tax=Vibrio tarriae TaxID=2014742 RepID=UPI000DE557F2|nr:hypothetical protein [Vibrio tarriae]RBM52264.1 hypothetical protein DLR64_09960 [Vibrio tarriae]